MATKYHELITDRSLILEHATMLLAHGYYAIPVGATNPGSTNDGKGWLYSNKNVKPYEPDAQGRPLPTETVLDIFRDFPGCGLSIAAPFTRDLRNDLLIIDVDVTDDETLLRVAQIIGSPCPVRVGSKGAAFFMRYPAMKTIPALLEERGIQAPKFAKAAYLGIPRMQKAQAFDLMGLKQSHAIIPPTLHFVASQNAGSPVHYRYIPFPGTDVTMALHETPLDELPELQPHQLLLLYQWAKSDKGALWEYIGNSSPGNHHSPMLAASTYLWHERFTQDEIEAICTAEAEASSPDEPTLRSRYQEIKTAVATLPRIAPEQKPSGEARSRGPKVPRDREILNYMQEKFPSEELGFFSGLPYWWNRTDGMWEAMTNPSHPEPWARMYNHLLRVFDDANHGIVVSALKSFIAGIPSREASPDNRLVPFINGVLDVTTGLLRPEERDDYMIARIGHAYDEDAECPLWDRFLHNLLFPPLEFQGRDTSETDHQKSIVLLEEFLGYCLTRSHAQQKMLFIIGATGVGKSVLIKVLRGLLPKNWCSTVAMDAFDEANSLIQMANAYINISAEVGRRSRNVDDVLLRVTAGEEVEVKLLYANRMQVVLPTRLLFHGNLVPDTTDVTGAIERRMIVLRTTDIKPEPVPMYENRLLQEAPGILKRLCEAYARLLRRGYFDIPAYSIEVAAQVTQDSNSCTVWMDACTETVMDAQEGTVNNDLYDHYAEWCTRNGMFKYSIIQWGKYLSAVGVPSVRARMPGNRFVTKRHLRLLSQVRAKY